MTSTSRTTSTSDPVTAQTHQTNRLAGWAPLALGTVGVIVMLIGAGTPVLDVVRYGLYLLIGVQIPGMLVHRALRGRPDHAVADLSLGGAVGMAVGMGGWAIFMLLGIQQFLWVWPLLILVLFAAVPDLRKHWTTAPYPEHVSTVSAWVLAAAAVFYTLALGVEHWHGQALPPKANFYYIDQYWHLANVAELTKSLPPDTASVTGRTLHYHWFVNAHVSIGHMISGVSAPVAYLRLWEPPFVAVILGLMFTLTRSITKRWWAAALASLMLVLPTQLMPWTWYKPWASFALTEGSPSQTFGVLVLLVGSIVLLPMLKGRSIGWGSWALLGAVGILGGGAKPAVLPVLLFGLGVVFLWRLFTRQKFWALMGAMAVLLAGLVVTSPLTAQAASGSSFKLFGLIYFSPMWTKFVGPENVHPPGSGPLILPGLGEWHNLRLAILMLIAIMAQFSFVFAGLALARRRRGADRAEARPARGRLNPIAIFLTSGFVIGMVMTFTIDHPGASEIYFARTGTPFGIILGVWGLSYAIRQAREKHSDEQVFTVLGAAVMTAIIIVLGVILAGGRKPERADLAFGLFRPMLVVGGVILAVAVVWWLLRRTAAPWLRGVGMVFFTTALLTTLSVQGPFMTGMHTVQAITGQNEKTLPPWHVTSKEVTGAQWMIENTPPKDVAATNVHCFKKVTYDRCEARSYWLPAFSERRYLVETWAYTEENLLQVDKYTGGFGFFPFDDPEKLRINDAAFTDPTPEGLATLRDKYGVKWLVAVTKASKVSPKLDELATLRYTNSDMRIYQLK
ncbi:hypothetical protein IEE94_14720 [Yimella sp. cx-573]|nr:hypothetical protein [Yimella sp. cx-573]